MSEGSKIIDVEQWLKSNKLAHIYDIFKSRNISIEEVVEFEDDDIAIFAKETLKLDILTRKRFVKAINKIKYGNIPQKKSYRKVIISVQEQRELTKLYQRFDECSKLQILIQKSLNQSNENSLNESQLKCINKINIIFDEIIEQFMLKKNELLKDIDDANNQKRKLLNEQLNILQKSYISVIENGKNECEQYTNGQNKKLDVLNLVESILSFNETPTTISVTKPEIKFDIANAVTLTDEFVDPIKINDCDKPLAPEMGILKVESNMISIQYDMRKEHYETIGKPILKICIEYALVKNDDQLWNDYKEEQHDDDSDTESNYSNSDSDSDRDSSSDNESDSDSSDEGNKFKTRKSLKLKKKKKKKQKKKPKWKEPKSKVMKMNISAIGFYDELKWFEMKEKIHSNKSKKHDKKYKLREKVKDNKTYILRMKLLNDSGWSDYNKQVCVVKTPKMVLNSKILSSMKDKMKLKKMIDKETRHKYKKWKLHYRASRDGVGESIFKAKCHDHRNLVCLLKSTNGNTFGGYTSSGWSGTHGGKSESDDKCFIFLLKSANNKKAAVFRTTNAAQSLYNQTSYYCFFHGSNNAFYMNKDGRTGIAAANNSGSFEPYPTSYYLTDTSNFGVLELEVFILKK